MKQAIPDNGQVNTICSEYDFRNVEQLKTFVNATWYVNNTELNYGGYYTDQLMQLTDMTVAEVATMFNTSITTSLGYYVENYSK